MSEEFDMLKTVAPKSDQINADDLIGGPRTITVTGVRGTGNDDQPVSVFFEGDGGKPYKPCKSMRRVMIAAWTKDAKTYVGRSMTLYCDPKVKFGGIEVGGIRISHMSHIDKEMTLALTATKANRKPFTVKPLKVAEDDGEAKALKVQGAEAAASGTEEYTKWGKALTAAQRKKVEPFLREWAAHAKRADAENQPKEEKEQPTDDLF